MLKRITESTIFNEAIGIIIATVETINSKKPYSVVVNRFVYKGTNKKLRNLLPKVLMVRIPVFFNKYLYLLFNILSKFNVKLFSTLQDCLLCLCFSRFVPHNQIATIHLHLLA